MATTGTHESGTVSAPARADGASARRGTGTRTTRILGLLTLLGLGWLTLFGLVLSPADANLGESVRLLYLHVGTAWLSYASFGVTALCSAMWLWKKTPGYDRVAAASAEVGVVFISLVLVTGSLWGRMTWGVYWTWDARLTSTALLLVLYLGYLAIRRLPALPHVRAKRAAITGIIAAVDIPIIRYSVDWWNTLHQKATLTAGDAKIDGLMLFTLFVGAVAFCLAYAWFVIHRYRVQLMEDVLEDRGVELAIAERLREPSGSAASSAASVAGASS